MMEGGRVWVRVRGMAEVRGETVVPRNTVCGTEETES